MWLVCVREKKEKGRTKVYEANILTCMRILWSTWKLRPNRMARYHLVYGSRPTARATRAARDAGLRRSKETPLVTSPTVKTARPSPPRSANTSTTRGQLPICLALSPAQTQRRPSVGRQRIITTNKITLSITLLNNKWTLRKESLDATRYVADF